MGKIEGDGRVGEAKGEEVRDERRSQWVRLAHSPPIPTIKPLASPLVCRHEGM